MKKKIDFYTLKIQNNVKLLQILALLGLIILVCGIPDFDSNQTVSLEHISTKNENRIENSITLYYPLATGLISTFLVAGPYSSDQGSLSHVDLTKNFKSGDIASISNNAVSGLDGSKIWTPTTDDDGIFGWDGTTYCSRYLLTYMYINQGVSNVYFYFNVDDDIQLFIDGEKRYDDSDGTSDSGTFDIGSLSSGWHRVLFVYYNGGLADESRVCLLANNNFANGYTALPGMALSLNPVDTFDDNDAMGGENRGFLKDWLITGSFWQETATWTALQTIGGDFINCSQQYYEGQKVSQGNLTWNSTYAAKSWQKYVSPTNKINFLDSSLSFTPVDFAAVYAYTKVYVPTSISGAYLFMGSDDGHRAYLDGTSVIYSHLPGGGRTAIIDEIKTPLGTISAGWHDLMIMVENYNGPWEMYVRFSASITRYEPILGLICSAPENDVTLTTTNSSYLEFPYNATESRTVEWEPTVSIDSANLDHDPVKVTEPMLWYNFENSDNLAQNFDTSKYNTGTVTGSPSQYLDAERGNVLDFNNGNNYLTLPNLGQFSQVTISFWICTLGNPDNLDAIFHDNSWDIQGDTHISLRGTNNRQIYTCVSGSSTDIENLNSPVLLQDFRWYFFTQVYSQATLNSLIYINGELNNNQSMSVSTYMQLDGINLGYYISGTERNLNARLDDVMVFNGILTSSEIRALYFRTPSWMQNETAAFSFNSSALIGVNDYGSHISANFTTTGVHYSDSIRGNVLSLVGSDGTGTNGFMQIRYKFKLTDEWTASAWYRDIETTNAYCTLFQGDNTHLMIRTVDRRLGAYDSMENVFVESGYSLTVAQLSGWHQIAAVGRGGRVYYYLDGNYVGTLNCYAPLNDTIYGIGNNYGSLTQRFADYIDDIRLYQRALNPTEILVLAQNATPCPTNGIYQFYSNNTVIQTGYWSNQNNITLNFTGNIGGIYNYRLKTTTSQGFSTNASIQINVDSKPKNPTNCIDLAGSSNNTWQNSVPKPNFIWSGASNLMSAIQGYYVYFGTSASGESTEYTEDPSYVPSFNPLNATVYYLRIRTVSARESYADWHTLFIFKYDLTTPTNPTTVSQTIGLTTSDVWQNSVDAPRFVWSNALDVSDIYGYYVYFGTNALGESSSFQTSNVFVSPSITQEMPHYLRVKTVDNARNNATTWETLYIFKYDHFAPQNPTVCNQTVDVTTSNVWQNHVTSPIFNWSGATDNGFGVSGYYIYWGVNSNGESTDFQTTTSYSLATPINESQIYYFRIQTTDGYTRAAWTTLYVFCYDIVAPTNPVTLTSTTHRPNVANIRPYINVTWEAATDNLSGIAGYCVIWTTNPNQIFDLIVNSTGLAASSPTLPNGEWYFVLYSIDNAGNWQKRSIGPYIVNRNAVNNENSDTTDSPDIYIYIGIAVGVVALGLVVSKVRARRNAGRLALKDVKAIQKKEYLDNYFDSKTDDLGSKPNLVDEFKPKPDKIETVKLQPNDVFEVKSEPNSLPNPTSKPPDASDNMTNPKFVEEIKPKTASVEEPKSKPINKIDLDDVFKD